MSDFRLGVLFSPDSTQKLLTLAEAKAVPPYVLLAHAIEALHRAQHLIEEGKGILDE